MKKLKSMMILMKTLLDDPATTDAIIGSQCECTWANAVSGTTLEDLEVEVQDIHDITGVFCTVTPTRIDSVQGIAS